MLGFGMGTGQDHGRNTWVEVGRITHLVHAVILLCVASGQHSRLWCSTAGLPALASSVGEGVCKSAYTQSGLRLGAATARLLKPRLGQSSLSPATRSSRTAMDYAALLPQARPTLVRALNLIQ